MLSEEENINNIKKSHIVNGSGNKIIAHISFELAKKLLILKNNISIKEHNYSPFCDITKKENDIYEISFKNKRDKSDHNSKQGYNYDINVTIEIGNSFTTKSHRLHEIFSHESREFYENYLKSPHDYKNISKTYIISDIPDEIKINVINKDNFEISGTINITDPEMIYDILAMTDADEAIKANNDPELAKIRKTKLHIIKSNNGRVTQINKIMSQNLTHLVRPFINVGFSAANRARSVIVSAQNRFAEGANFVQGAIEDINSSVIEEMLLLNLTINNYALNDKNDNDRNPDNLNYDNVRDLEDNETEIGENQGNLTQNLVRFLINEGLSAATLTKSVIFDVQNRFAKGTKNFVRGARNDISYYFIEKLLLSTLTRNDNDKNSNNLNYDNVRDLADNETEIGENQGNLTQNLVMFLINKSLSAANLTKSVIFDVQNGVTKGTKDFVRGAIGDIIISREEIENNNDITEKLLTRNNNVRNDKNLRNFADNETENGESQGNLAQNLVMFLINEGFSAANLAKSVIFDVPNRVTKGTKNFVQSAIEDIITPTSDITQGNVTNSTDIDSDDTASDLDDNQFEYSDNETERKESRPENTIPVDVEYTDNSVSGRSNNNGVDSSVNTNTSNVGHAEIRKNTITVDVEYTDNSVSSHSNNNGVDSSVNTNTSNVGHAEIRKNTITVDVEYTDNSVSGHSNNNGVDSSVNTNTSNVGHAEIRKNTIPVNVEYTNNATSSNLNNNSEASNLSMNPKTQEPTHSEKIPSVDVKHVNNATSKNLNDNNAKLTNNATMSSNMKDNTKNKDNSGAKSTNFFIKIWKGFSEKLIRCYRALLTKFSTFAGTAMGIIKRGKIKSESAAKIVTPSRNLAVNNKIGEKIIGSN